MGTSAMPQVNPGHTPPGVFEELIGELTVQVGRMENTAQVAGLIADRYTGTRPKPDEAAEVPTDTKGDPLTSVLRSLERRMREATDAVTEDLERLDAAWK